MTTGHFLDVVLRLCLCAIAFGTVYEVSEHMWNFPIWLSAIVGSIAALGLWMIERRARNWRKIV